MSFRYPTGVKNFHPCEKPTSLVCDLLSLFSREGDTILDCFMESGTTGVACKKLNRDFIGMELNEDYFKIAQERIGDTTTKLF